MSALTKSALTKAAVIGHPVTHSKSPLIHNAWISRYGLAGSYEAIDIAPENLEKGVRDLVDRGYAGFNVTIPHKSAILPLCRAVSDIAARIGAANTIIVQKDGTLQAENTDVFGFVENIRQNAPGFDFASGPALVLGAGGAARAVIEGLLDQGCPEIILCNRTLARAQQVAATARWPERIRVEEWDRRHAEQKGATLLVNTTQLGMTGQPSLDLSLENLDPRTCVVDIVYAPLETELLRAAKMRGNPVVTGIGMLLHQARPAFAAWFGILPDITAPLMKKVLA